MHRGDCENLFEPWSARNERKRRIRGNKSTLLKYVGSPGSNGSKGENSEEKRRKFVEGNEREERHFLTSRVETDEWLGNEWSLLSRTEQKPRKQNSSTAGVQCLVAQLPLVSRVFSTLAPFTHPRALLS